MYPIYQSKNLSKKKKAKIFRSLFEPFSNQQLDSSIRKIFFERKRIHPSTLFRKRLSWQTWSPKILVAFSPMIPRDRDSKGSRKRRSRFILTPFIPFEFSPGFLSPRSEKRIDPIFGQRREEEASRGMRRGWRRMWKPPQRACSHLLKTGIYIYRVTGQG